MSESKSKMSGTARGASSLEALSKTIDGLEARLETLVARKSGSSTERESLPDDAPDAPRESIAAEILQRQRMLDRERANLEARLGARRQPPVNSATDKALREITDSLAGLRADLKREVSESLGRELSAMREEIGAASREHAQPLPGAMREEMLRLADCIERFGARASAGEADGGLAGEVRAMRAMLEEVSSESRRSLSSVESRLEEIDPPTLRSEVKGLVQRLDEMKDDLAVLAGTSDGSEIEAQLKNVAAALETLAEQVNLDEASIDHRFTDMAGRLDEISRAIVSVGSRSDRSKDAETLARIENRLTGLSSRIDEIGERNGSADRLMERMTVLAERMDALASEDAVAGLADRLDQLSLMLEHAGARSDDADLTRHLTEISAKMDALDHATLEGALASRFDDLAGRIDALAAGLDAAGERMLGQAAEFSAGGSASTEPAMPPGLEERLAEIAERLDDLRTTTPDADAVRQLESRLARLSELMSQPLTGEEGAALTPRLTAIEEHLETTDEYIIEAARQAAEAVVEAYGRSGSGQSAVQAGELAAISELAEDLRALEQLSQRSEERTARAFDAVHDTLVRIAEHLEAVGPRSSGPRATEEPAEKDDDGADWHEEEFGPTAPATAVAAGAAGEEQTQAPGDDGTAKSDEVTLSEDDGFQSIDIEPEDRPVEKKGLLAKVGERMRPSRREPEIDDEAGDDADQPERKSVALAPSIDPSEALDRPAAAEDEEDVPLNEPLEPGSGPPDIERILQKVREVQNQDVRRDDKSDFIAAARRAAQAAAAEVETVTGARNRKRRGGLAAMIAAHRRPILLAVGAVLLAVMSWPLASALLQRPDVAVAVHAPAKPASTSKVAAASKPKVSEEKTGATTAQGPSLPKVRAVPDASGSGAEQKKTAAPAKTPSALKAASDPKAASAAGSAEAEAPATGSATDKPARKPESTGDARSAPQADTATTATPPAAAATQPADKADGGNWTKAAAPSAGADANAEQTAAADAIPQLPAGIGPESLRVAVSKADPKALYEIGVFYTQGRGVQTDLAAAAKWYRAAAERGLAPAQYRLANLYEKGSGVERDMTKARDWYLKAAGQGNVSAMHNLAVLYAMGRDGKPDYAAAAEWFRKAADHGVKDSQFNLAILYAQGRGVPRDLTQSYKWFAVAASTGDSDAVQKRDEVAAALDAADLKKARAAASEWKAKPVDPSANEVTVPPQWNGADSRTASVDMSKAIRNIQAILDDNGFDAGKPDGIMGAKTRSAIRAFQKSVGDEPTGKVTDALIRKLLDLNQHRKDGSNS